MKKEDFINTIHRERNVTRLVTDSAHLTTAPSTTGGLCPKERAGIEFCRWSHFVRDHYVPRA
ncbi:MAG: hypothetical protein IK100_00395 [Muribaculaceae bacterium]|nr:hypothetical protein [Muribaculaceae bacterium]